MRTNEIFAVGDIVTYRRTFLRSCGLHTGHYAFRRGEIVEARDTGAKRYRASNSDILYVRWTDEPDLIQPILACNVINVKRLHLEPV